MTCEDCASDRNRYDPACLTCGGRLIRDLQAMQIPLEVKRARLRDALAQWLAFGHAESELRRLGAKEVGRARRR